MPETVDEYTAGDTDARKNIERGVSVIPNVSGIYETAHTWRALRVVVANWEMSMPMVKLRIGYVR